MRISLVFWSGGIIAISIVGCQRGFEFHLAGVVRDAVTGKPIDGARVLDSFSVERAKTDVSGRFKLRSSGFLEGDLDFRHWVTFVHGDYASERVEFSIPDIAAVRRSGKIYLELAVDLRTSDSVNRKGERDSEIHPNFDQWWRERFPNRFPLRRRAP